MSSNDRVLYPMLGVGAFFALFWTGFVLAYELGWACNAILVNGLFFGCLGSYFIVRLERHDTRGAELEPHPERKAKRQPARARNSRDASRPYPVG